MPKTSTKNYDDARMTSCLYLTTKRSRKLLWLLLALVLATFTLISFYAPPRRQFINLTQSQRPDDTGHVFVRSPHDDTYLYSAIVEASPALQLSRQADVVVTALDRSRDSLHCCVLVDNDNVTVYVTPARPYFRSYMTRTSFFDKISEHFAPSIYLARQYRCAPTWTSHKPRYVTLTSSACSSNIYDYLPVVYPRMQRGQLAICAKVAHSPGLEAQKIIEWFEMQIILGVDTVLLYNLGVDETITKILHHYEHLGVLQTLPYELPGEPKNRNLGEAMKRTRQFTQDETLAVLDCKLRMSGYDFVLSHDLDEIVIPRDNVTLKELFKNSLTKHPNAAGFYFFTAFYIVDWPKTNPEETLMVKSYRKSTVPRWECYKFVFIPNRTRTILTHEVFPKQEYTVPTLMPRDVILHHYRKCPIDTWGTCSVPTVTDDVMTRYGNLDARVIHVFKDILKINIT